MKLAPVIALLSSALIATALSAQTLDPALLLKPPTDNWPTYNGDYSGRGGSSTSGARHQRIRDGVQVAAAEWALVKRMPASANRSILGVLTRLAP